MAVPVIAIKGLGTAAAKMHISTIATALAKKGVQSTVVKGGTVAAAAAISNRQNVATRESKGEEKQNSKKGKKVVIIIDDRPYRPYRKKGGK